MRLLAKQQAKKPVVSFKGLQFSIETFYFLWRSRRRRFLRLCLAIFALLFFFTEAMLLLLHAQKFNLNHYQLKCKDRILMRFSD